MKASSPYSDGRTYGFKLVDFLCNYNCVEVKNADDLRNLKQILSNCGLGGILEGKYFDTFESLLHLVNINIRNNNTDTYDGIYLEYQNSKGITFTTDFKGACQWFGLEPYSVDELVAEQPVRSFGKVSC